MISHYQQEMTRIHPTKELVNHTRERMQKAEQRKHTVNISLKLIWAVPMAAALFLTVFVSLHFGINDSTNKVTKEFSQTQDKQPLLIENTSKLVVTKVSEMPPEYADLVRIEGKNYSYYLLADEKENFYSVYVQTENQDYVICGKAANLEEFIYQMDTLLTK